MLGDTARGILDLEPLRHLTIPDVGVVGPRRLQTEELVLDAEGQVADSPLDAQHVVVGDHGHV